MENVCTLKHWSLHALVSNQSAQARSGSNACRQINYQHLFYVLKYYNTLSPLNEGHASHGIESLNLCML